MFRLYAIASIAAAVGSLGGVQTASAQGTIRIEPRPFYGAVVTLEEGVRVFRPLPPDRYVIINPGEKTPLSISINDTHVSERRIIQNYNSDGGRGMPRVYGRRGAAWGVGQGGYHGRHFEHGRVNGGGHGGH
jgi:hypothetical protein